MLSSTGMVDFFFRRRFGGLSGELLAFFSFGFCKKRN
jgi:hypothetical protein